MALYINGIKVAGVGANGINGAGLPADGDIGQILIKKSETPYDTEWSSLPVSDVSLTEAGKYADSKTVGDKFTAIETRMDNLATEEYVNIRIPAWTEDDEGAILQIVNGTPAWIKISNAEETSF